LLGSAFERWAHAIAHRKQLAHTQHKGILRTNLKVASNAFAQLEALLTAGRHALAKLQGRVERWKLIEVRSAATTRRTVCGALTHGVDVIASSSAWHTLSTGCGFACKRQLSVMVGSPGMRSS
jgi:hypothetical protein